MAKLFKTVDWANGTNIYEVNIRQYTKEGTFEAFGKHLPRLREMGVETLWLMPITPISKEGRLGSLGSYYACSSYVSVNPEFGTLKDFQLLVYKAHELGFKVIIDWVANHTGIDHEWTRQYTNYYVQDSTGKFTERNGWKDVIDLNYNNNDMREQMINAMRFWVKEFNIDGFRCDMAHLVPVDFWVDARTSCDAIKPLFWLAECEDVNYHTLMDVTYAWQWMHVSEKFAKNQVGLPEIFNTLHHYSQYPNDCFKLFFTSNHDENSWNGTEYEKYGNAAKALSIFTCTWQNGIPLVYSGQELPNKKRLKFFDKDPIDWQKQVLLNDFYKNLFSLRKLKAINNGETFILPSGHLKVMAYLRKFETEIVLVILNLSNENKTKFQIDHQWLDGNFKNLFSNLEYHFKTKESFELMAYDYYVFVKE